MHQEQKCVCRKWLHVGFLSHLVQLNLQYFPRTSQINFPTSLYTCLPNQDYCISPQLAKHGTSKIHSHKDHIVDLYWICCIFPSPTTNLERLHNLPWIRCNMWLENYKLFLLYWLSQESLSFWKNTHMIVVVVERPSHSSLVQHMHLPNMCLRDNSRQCLLQYSRRETFQYGEQHDRILQCLVSASQLNNLAWMHLHLVQRTKKYW